VPVALWRCWCSSIRAAWVDGATSIAQNGEETAGNISDVMRQTRTGYGQYELVR
jgi:hypothetical protein